MKNRHFATLPLLATTLLLSACGGSSPSSSSAKTSSGTSSALAVSSSSSSSSASSSASSAAASSSSSASTSSSASSTIPSSSSETASTSTSLSASSSSSSSSSSSLTPQEEYGDFKVTYDDSQAANFSYDDSTNTYTFTIPSGATDKPKYTLSGYFDGSLIVKSGDTKNAVGMTLVLDHAYLTNSSSGGVAISYQAKKKALTLTSTADTINYVKGSGDAVYSTNNAEICGEGSLYLSSVSANAVEANDIRLYGDVSVDATAGGDAFKSAKGVFASDNSGSATSGTLLPFTGSVLLHDLGGSAFDFTNTNAETDDDKNLLATINIASGTEFVVSSASHMAIADLSITVEGSLVGSDIQGATIVPVTTGSLTLTVAEGATFVANGTPIVSGTY